MKRIFPYFIFVSTLVFVPGCKSDKETNVQAAVAEVPAKSIVSVNNTNDVTAKMQEGGNIAASLDTLGLSEGVTEVELTADELVKKAIASKPKVKLASTKSTKEKKVVKKEVRKKKTKSKTKVMKAFPKAEFDEVSFDFGEITEGDIIEHKFTFTNTGKTNLSIEKATATCGCTKPSFPFIDIKPGETGYIGVTYNSVNKSGDQKPEITVYSNTKQKVMTLYLSGTVKPKSIKNVGVEKDSTSNEITIQDSTKIIGG